MLRFARQMLWSIATRSPHWASPRRLLAARAAETLLRIPSRPGGRPSARRRRLLHTGLRAASVSGGVETLEIRALLSSVPVADVTGPSSISEGDGLYLDASGSYDPDMDSLSFAWDVDGDGSYDEVTGESPSLLWSELQSYGLGDDGTYTISVEVSDGVDGSGYDSLGVTVLNVDPTVDGSYSGTPAYPGDTITVEATFTDPAEATDTYTYIIDWGDRSTPDSGSVSYGQAVSGDHEYLTADSYTITVTVEDDDGGFDTWTDEVPIDPVDPVVIGDPSIDEGWMYSVSLNDSTGDGADSWTVDWGDGTIETIPGFGSSTSADHTYADDDPTATGSDQYTIQATAHYNGMDFPADPHAITVWNVDPTVDGSTSGTPAYPGDTITVEATFTDDAQSADSYTYTVDWGDGSTPDGGSLSYGQAISEEHDYAAWGSYTITVTVTDDDGGFDTWTEEMSIGAVDPTVSGGATVEEGWEYMVSLSDWTLNGADSWTVDWGDGSAPEIIPGSGAGASAYHTYADDDPTGTGSDQYTIEATAHYNGMDFPADPHVVTVWNVDPLLDNVLISGGPDFYPGETATLDAEYTDPAAGYDTFEYTVDWGDGSEPVTGTASGGSFAPAPHVFTAAGTYTVTVTLEDDDGGEDTWTDSITVSPYQVAIYASDAEAAETDTPLAANPGQFTFTRSGSTDAALTVTYQALTGAQNHAVEGDDYTASGFGSVTFGIGVNEVTVDVNIVNDSLWEDTEELWFEITPDTGLYEITGTGQDYITILDNDIEVILAVDQNPDSQCNCSCSCGAAVSNKPWEPDPKIDGLRQLGLPSSPYMPLLRGSQNPHPVVRLDVRLPSGVVADSYEVTVDLGGVSETVQVSAGGFSAEDWARLSLMLDVQTLATGRQSLSVDVTPYWPDGSGGSVAGDTVTAVSAASNAMTVVNRKDSPFGRAWWVDQLNALEVTSGGVNLIRGDGTAAYYASDGAGGYTTPGGTFSGLHAEVDGTYTLHDHHTGGTQTYSAAGLLTAKTDANGNATSYAYVDADGDGTAAELSKVTDPDGREFSYTYTAGGLLDTLTDFAGRTFDFAHDAATGTVTSITGPDPDGAGSQAAPVVQFAYDPATLLVSSVTDPLGKTTSFTYGADRRLRSITRPGSVTETFEPLDAQGLEEFIPLDEAEAVSTSPEGGTTAVKTDAYGYVTEHTDPLGNTTSYERDANGLPTQMTLPDPDGAGPLAAMVVTYVYDAHGRQLSATYDDGTAQTSEQWTYDTNNPHLHEPLTYTNRLEETWTYTYDAAGNLLTETDPLAHVTTYTYDAAGRLATLTEPDPDGAGPLTAAVTTYGYDAKGRLDLVTFADSSTQEYAYDAADNLTSETNELGQTTSYTHDAYGRVLTVTQPDPDGAGPLTAPVTSYTYDAIGQLLTETDPLGNVTSYAYDDLGRLVTLTLPDPDGAGALTAPVTSYGYDGDGNLTSETDPLGHVTSYTYDLAGNLLSLTLPDPDDTGPLAAPVTSYTYDAWRRLLTETDAANGVTTYAYDADGNLASITDALSRQTAYDYDVVGNLLSVTQPDPDGTGPLTAPVASFTYDDAGRLLTETDPLGNVTGYAYDNTGKLLSVTLPDPDDAGPLTAPVTSYAYDSVGNLASETDPLGNVTSYAYDDAGNLLTVTLADPDDTGPLTSPVTTYAYDDLGRLLTETDALSNVTSYAYDAAGRLLSIEDPLGNTTSYAYDDLGRRTSITQPDPDGAGPLSAPVTSFTYDAAGKLLSETDPLGNTTSYDYDDLGRMTSITLPDPDDAGSLSAPVTNYGYDVLGRRTSVTDPLGNVTSYAYDAIGNLLSITQPDPDGAGALTAPVTSYAYDNLNRRISETDPLNNSTSYAYDAAGRLLSETNALSGVTSYAYDNLGRRTSLTDPEQNTTTWTYDLAGRVTSETNDLSDVRTFVYDNLGRLIERTDRNGRIREFDYDALGRTTEERWLESDGVTLVDTITWTYDAASRLTSVADDDSSYAYTYDGLDRLTEVDNASTPDMPGVVQSYAYDAAGRSTSAAATVDSVADFINTYVYDALGRMTSITQTDGDLTAGLPISDKRVELSYDALGRFETIARYENAISGEHVATSSYAYDAAGRLTDLDHVQGTTTLAFYDWTYDAHGRLTGFTSTDGSTSYSYDDTDQLTGVDYDYQSDESYTYDANGNRTNTGYSTGTNNRLLSDGTHTYEYDDEGNRTKKTTTATGEYVTYSWDHKNHLTAVSYYTAAGVLTKRVEYDYDPTGRRLRKNVDDDGNGIFDRGERFIYDSAGKIDPASGVAIDDLVLLYATGDPTANPAGSLKTRFLHGPEIDQIFADEDALGEILWSLSDHQGSVRDLVDYDPATDTTSVENHIIYDAFGVIVTQTAPLLTPHHAYTAQEWDADAGLYHYNARWYDAFVGWFVSEDPRGFDAGDTNLGRYGGNSPTNGIDPSGQSFISFLAKSGAKKATKTLLKKFIREQIETRIKKITIKKFAKQFAKEAENLTSILADPWWQTAIGCIPLVGDAFDLVNTPLKIRKAIRAADRLEAKVKKILEIQHKLAEKLIPARLLRSNGVGAADPLLKKTYKEIIEISGKGGPDGEKASIIKKLIEQQHRLMEKI